MFGSLIHSVSRNPSLSKQLFGYAILGFALSEAMALFALLVAFLILFGLIGFVGSLDPACSATTWLPHRLHGLLLCLHPFGGVGRRVSVGDSIGEGHRS